MPSGRILLSGFLTNRCSAHSLSFALQIQFKIPNLLRLPAHDINVELLNEKLFGTQSGANNGQQYIVNNYHYLEVCPSTRYSRHSNAEYIHRLYAIHVV